MTILRDRVTRESKGVAFILFVERASAQRAIQALNHKELFGRTLKVCVATDNGRTKDFIKRKVYKDKSRCYECGESGHLSYKCPKNQLGDREKPTKKKKKKLSESGKNQASDEPECEEEEIEDDFGLGDAIRMCQEMREMEATTSSAPPPSSLPHAQPPTVRNTIKPDSYFSDEDASD